MDWITYAVLGALAVGASTSLFRMPAFKGYSSLHSTFWVNVFSLLLSLIVFAVYGNSQNLFSISWLGILWGVLFALVTAQQKLLLHRMETNTLLPVTSSLSNILTVAIGVFFFVEVISLLQYTAIAIILLSVFMYSQKRGGLILDKNSITFGLGIIIASTLAKAVQKIAATHESIVHFAVYQFVGAIFCAFILIYLFERRTIPDLFKIGHTWKITSVTAFFMTLGGYAFLLALAIGPLAGVYPVAASYVIVTATLGVWLYKEKLTAYKFGLMMLTFVGIVLMKLG
jgi:drug/metabolite transporter (DMT)-like permease